MDTGLLALADGRLPAGSYAHSYGVEPAGLSSLEELRSFLRGRLFAVLPAERALSSEGCRLGPRSWASLAAEADARCASPALRAAARARGRGLLRVGRQLFVDEAVLPRELPEAVALGAMAWMAGASAAEADALTLYAGIAGPAYAAVRLMPLDPTDVAALVAEMCAAAPPPAPVGVIPASSAPLAELDAEAHALKEGRLFAS